ncbi:MAG: hypothetical protein EB103_06790, partial [Actinobacteria bacterium]|nr:hypothetical protein [Actinomycetota bacterium]
SGARTNLGLAIGTNVPSPTGTGASGTWAINITGNAATASNAGFPSYSSGSRSTITYDSLWQAPSNGIVTISAVGSYINGLQVEVGSTSSLGTVIAILANDFNNNTWGQSFSFPIKSGSYAKVSRWSGSSYDFETINIYFWTVS